MRAVKHICLWLIALVLSASLGLAQAADAPAVLVADDIQLTRDRKLIATGNVEAFQNGQKLTASRIQYDQTTGALQIEGPLVLDDGNNTVVLADQAELDAGFQNGLLKGAQVVIDQQLQLAAVEMNRVAGRYTQLYRVAVTACRICEDPAAPPLWQIRASRVIHDTQTRQLYFDNAQLRVMGLPILSLPRLRLPDPTLDRATGFLIPRFFTTSQLGTGIKVPYFIKLGDHRDVTLTPVLSGNTRTLEYRYRQAFRNGRFEIIGAYTRDDLQPGDTRGYAFATGYFHLKRDYVLSFDIEAVSDNAYLAQYDYLGKDRLDSAFSISRARRDQYVAGTFINYRSLRDDEDNETIPNNVIEAMYEQRVFPSAMGGELRFSALAHAHERPSTSLVDGPDSDTIVDGRDVLRASVNADWRRMWTSRQGLQVQTQLGAAADVFSIKQDPAYPDTEAGVTPYASVKLRYPMVRHSSNGVVHHLEPVMQLAWAGGSDLSVPNDESTRPEFDEGNLLALSRFPSEDRRERGRALAYGVTWTRIDPAGWDASLTLGQVIRSESEPDFTVTSGLGGSTSDFLLAGELRVHSGLRLTSRTLFNDSLDIAKSEFRGDWSYNKIGLGGSYVYLGADPDEDRLEANSELNLTGRFALDKNWLISAGTRYDFEDGRTATANLGLVYENECVRLDLTILREYADSASIEPTTNVGLTVGLNGFAGRSGKHGRARSCSAITF